MSKGKKNQGNDMWQVGKRQEASSFLKIRLRVIHKKRKKKENKGKVRERGSTFSLDFSTIGP